MCACPSAFAGTTTSRCRKHVTLSASAAGGGGRRPADRRSASDRRNRAGWSAPCRRRRRIQGLRDRPRSEEHTSDSSHQIISYAVFCLKKKKTNKYVVNIGD